MERKSENIQLAQSNHEVILPHKPSTQQMILLYKSSIDYRHVTDQTNLSVAAYHHRLHS